MKLKNKHFYIFGGIIIAVFIVIGLLSLLPNSQVEISELPEEFAIGKEKPEVASGGGKYDEMTFPGSGGGKYEEKNAEDWKEERKSLSDDLKSKDGFKSHDDLLKGIEYADYLQRTDPCIVEFAADANEYLAKVINGECIN